MTTLADKQTAYVEFLKRKIPQAEVSGFEPSLPIHAKLFEWQKLIVEWSLRRGRAALFEECGLGKTIQQLEWARQVSFKTGKPVLILCPLAVAAQTVREAELFGFPPVKHVRQPEEITGEGTYITNYERLELFQEIIFKLGGVVLDESSILKSFMGRTRAALTECFSKTPYRLCCTATPAPNDFEELGNHSEFLGLMSRTEMLATWFINDTANTGTWRLKKHASEDFWKWVASWAACISKPSDLGFPGDDFVLPPLNLIPVWVDVDETESAGDELFRLPGMSASNISKEMRLTNDARCKAAAGIANSLNEAWVIWCNLNDEADELELAIKDCVEVRGCDRPEHKETKLLKFTTGEVKRIITKASIAGYGLNWQHCHNVICFPSYSFEDFYQLIRRSYRFGQKHPVNCHMVLPRTASNVLKTLREKLSNHEMMRDAMRFSAETILSRQTPITIMKEDITSHVTDNWTMHNGDCVRVAETIADESIDFSVFSPPFADLFVYSADIQDMGNCRSMDEFMEQFGFLVKHLHRVIKPGRLCAVHCADLLATKWKDGEIELKNFSGQIIDRFRSEGWLYHCRVTIWKDPVVEMQRTKSLGLLHKQLLKDSAMSRVGMPEYVCIFRKPGKNANPVNHQREDYPVEVWQKDASPVWMDVDQGKVLNGRIARENRDERHICPLQLDVIERLLRLYTNPNDLVFSPFAGIGSEGYCAVKSKRRFIGAELKPSYYELACANLREAQNEAMTLFDLPKLTVRDGVESVPPMETEAASAA
jgi:DNA modification methylase